MADGLFRCALHRLRAIIGLGALKQLRRASSRGRMAGLSTAVLSAASLTAGAQPAYPSRPVTMIVPYTAGGSSDYGARLMSGELGKRLGQTVIIENIAGAGGALGVQKLIRSNPDGFTLLYGSLSETVLVPMVNPSVNYKPDELLPVALTGTTPVAFIVKPDFPANNMDEFIALARRSPGKYTYGSPGIGTFQHVMAETVKSRTGIFIVHIPYRGGQNLVTDLLAGQIDIGVTGAPNVMPLLEAKRVKVLGVSSRARLSALKEVPSFGDSAALKGLDLQTWGMVFAPPGTPEPLVARINAAVNEVMQMPEMREARLKAGSELARPLSPAETRAFFLTERDTYRPIAARIKPE